MDVRDLLDNPGTAAYSRIKYLQRFGSQEEVAQFLSGLFRAAVEARYTGEWRELESFLHRWEDVAIDYQFRSMKFPEEGPTPWSRLNKPLSEATVALVTTGGLYLEGGEPFQERGDPTYRVIPRNAPRDSLRIWHPGYDHGPALQDVNCIFPIDRFEELEAEGVIGSLAGNNYSFMGLIPDPTELMERTAPELARRLKDEGVDAVFLAST